MPAVLLRRTRVLTTAARDTVPPTPAGSPPPQAVQHSQPFNRAPSSLTRVRALFRGFVALPHPIGFRTPTIMAAHTYYLARRANSSRLHKLLIDCGYRSISADSYSPNPKGRDEELPC